MKKMKAPNKLSAIISKLDLVVSVGITLACIGTLVISSMQFKNSLSDINSDTEALNILPYEPSYVTERDTQTHNSEEIMAAWKGRYADKGPQKTITEMCARFYMQPHNPDTLADLVVVGTYTGHNKYRYKSFVANIRIDKLLSPLGETSKLEIGGEKKKSTYRIPSLNLRKGDSIKVYDEVTVQTANSGEREIAKGSSRNPYSHCFTPLKPNGQYLFFLNYSRKTSVIGVDTARFKLVPSLYGRIPISSEKTFEPNIFCANLPTKDIAENNTVKPLGVTNTSEAPDEDFNRQWQEAYERLPKFTYRDATKIDLFVDTRRTEQLYRDTAAKILQKYLGSA